MANRFLIFFMILSINVFAENLVDKEIYFDQENKIIGEKHYIYNSKNNISEIYTFQNGKMESKTEYIYESNVLMISEDYISSKTMLSYSVYSYREGRITKKTDYNPDQEILFIQNYIFDKNGLLTGIEFRNRENEYSGEKKFIYSAGKITEEDLLDNKKKTILKKKYIYENNNIKNIEIYGENGIKLRVIERTYLNKSDKTSSLGLRENFYDIK